MVEKKLTKFLLSSKMEDKTKSVPAVFTESVAPPHRISVTSAAASDIVQHGSLQHAPHVPFAPTQPGVSFVRYPLSMPAYVPAGHSAIGPVHPSQLWQLQAPLASPYVAPMSWTAAAAPSPLPWCGAQPMQAPLQIVSWPPDNDVSSQVKCVKFVKCH